MVLEVTVASPPTHMPPPAVLAAAVVTWLSSKLLRSVVSEPSA